MKTVITRICFAPSSSADLLVTEFHPSQSPLSQVEVLAYALPSPWIFRDADSINLVAEPLQLSPLHPGGKNRVTKRKIEIQILCFLHHYKFIISYNYPKKFIECNLI
jgi:hypothetical protein